MSMSGATEYSHQSTNKKELLKANEVSHSHATDNKSTRKRKRELADKPLEIWQPFDIQTSLPRLGSPKHPLIPRILIPRSCLPLAFLDPVGDIEATSRSRIFTTDHGLLEDIDELQRPEPTLLIAQGKNDDRFYALESVQTGVYATCRLGGWVAEDALQRLEASAWAYKSPGKKQCRIDPEHPTGEWWRSAARSVSCIPTMPTASTVATSQARGLNLSLKRPLQNSDPSGPARIASPHLSIKEPLLSAVDGVVEQGLQKPDEILRLIRNQYQETLYLSRASLAYFAKGPLSRARASFQHGDGYAYHCSTLTQYLRTMILTLPTMDKKYRETLPTLVKQYPLGTLSDGEGASVIETFRKSTRKTKKEKVGKDGLYPGEDVNIAQWWLSRDISSVACDTDEARQESLKTSILEQRAREAQLQIILVLETLSLEANGPFPGHKTVPYERPDLEHDDAATKVKKPKKPQDLHTLLDLLADRLCIWQSMTFNVEKPSPNDERPPSTSGKSAALNDDHLRQFCIDVVIPFYGARLPEMTTLLCKKLGGPKDPSPKRPAHMSLSSRSKFTAKPGAPIQRQQPQKSRRTLERVLTDEKPRHKRQNPSLSRSATEPMIPQIKREVSDVTLSSIPLNRVAMSKRYTQREVDLRAASQATEARHKKKIAVQQELQGAIAAIKKPNPKVAGREFVEAVEKRQANSHSRSKKLPVSVRKRCVVMLISCEETKNLARNPFAQGLQVMATPSKSRKTESYKLPNLPQVRDTTMTYEIDGVPPSSVSRSIPSSTAKLQGPSSSGDRTTSRSDHRPPSFVDQTPTRSSTKFIDFSSFPIGRAPIDEAARAQLSNSFLRPPDESYRLPTWQSSVHETPSKTHDQVLQTSPMPITNLQATPCRQTPSSKPPAFASPSPSPQHEEPDLYARLGWNYEIDD